MLNRESIFNAIEECVAAANAAGEHFAVLILRVPGLREISLRFGYAQGEQAEDKAHALTRDSLRPGDQVFRAGDDSFVVLLPSIANHNHAMLAGTRLIHAFEQPLDGTASPWLVRPVMGIAIYPEHGPGADHLCRRAGMALDESQRRGEPCTIYRQHDIQIEIFYEELREALDANRLRVFFQPIVNLRTGRIAGAESLARWSSPKHGEVSPANFVPFSEQSDLISILTRWSVNATMRHMASLHGAPELSFSINFSPRVLSRPGMVEQLLGALDIWGVAPTSIVVEITETTLVNDLEVSIQVLRRLREHGMRIAIDDFGTGYASIAYLRQFPATELKLDQSLIAGMRNDPHAAKLVRAIITMAHNMDLSTVAEGIEEQVTQDMLADIGCDYGQGFHLGRPEPAADFIRRLSASRPADS
ncbi:MAG: phosphodiesterase [Pseudomonadota bacterium]|jgi:diguanylate cyclase (GGDEF)-like protein|nr:phosphodiesterase [Xanthomonadaceae bacterium]MDE2248826.1 phosphodiesterase [Xanthomonadaceae bacterium]MDE3210385.1 phosphodiesterase [Pseudomonadota bacterium]